ncbi:hypothetical protein Q5762_26525 [Streptomyces sp. P9(2023)]|nr:hypothetical protein [Streptomyces sp. P9(2023)]MDT9691826.1 hypothetical protein [Streptomyces sp. P9(2023)]
MPIRASSRAPIPPDFSRAGGVVEQADRTEAAWVANAAAAADASRSTSLGVTGAKTTEGGTGWNGACQPDPRSASVTSAGIRAGP